MLHRTTQVIGALVTLLITSLVHATVIDVVAAPTPDHADVTTPPTGADPARSVATPIGDTILVESSFMDPQRAYASLIDRFAVTPVNVAGLDTWHTGQRRPSGAR